MADATAKRPIIVIKKKISGGGHHGGAWKVAYADFVTAMMSLFIVLWLLNSTPQVKKSVSGYFNDPHGSGEFTGTSALGAGDSVTIDTTNAEKLKKEIQNAIIEQKDLDKLSKQIEITVTGEGLRIEIMEEKGGTFFESGSAKLSPSGIILLHTIAGQLRQLPNRILIEGHTDAKPYASDTGYTNWELSADRANSARHALQDGGDDDGGLRSDQVAQVRGYADQSLKVKDDPLDPSNRRISVIVKWIEALPGTSPDGSAEKGDCGPGTEKGKEGDKIKEGDKAKEPEKGKEGDKGKEGEKPKAPVPCKETKPSAAKPSAATPADPKHPDAKPTGKEKPSAAKPEPSKPEAKKPEGEKPTADAKGKEAGGKEPAGKEDTKAVPAKSKFNVQTLMFWKKKPSPSPPKEEK